jgi:predicted RNase H-like nuclease
VDGCRAGWVAVAQTLGGQLSYRVFPVFASIFEYYADALILVDVPIGLIDSGPDERLCDREARRLLKGRASSVFPAPVRAALYATDYRAAAAANHEATQGRRSLTRQSWAITPKIREVNECLAGRKSPLPGVREMHPEVCFWSLNGRRPLRHGKKTDEGYRERAALLSRLLPGADALEATILREHRRNAVRRDDVVDAMVGSSTAWLGKRSLSTLPLVPERDSAGLPMEMVYVPPPVGSE